MALIAFLLGAGFAWLFHHRWQHYVEPFKDDKAKYDEAHRLLKEVLFWSLLVAIVVVTAVLVWALHDRYVGKFWSGPARTLYILTSPIHFTAIACFVLGVLVVLARDTLVRLFRNLTKHGEGSDSKDISIHEDKRDNQEKDAKEGARSGAVARQTYPWLTGIVGIAAVTLLAIVTLVIFFPEVLTRVESIKVAGIEARFATSTQVPGTASSAARGADQPSTGTSTSYLFSVTAWRGIESLFDDRVDKVRQRFVVKDADVPSKQKQDLAREFLKWHAGPLSEVLGCHLNDVGNIYEPIVRSKLALLATTWIRVLRAPRDQAWAEQFNTAKKNHLEFVTSLDQALYERQSRCGGNPARPAYGTSPRSRRDAAYFGAREYDSSVQKTVANPEAVLSNGYVIAFFASMMAFGQSSARAVEFMNEMEAILDPSDEAIVGRLNFYYNRSNAQYYAEPWDFTVWKPDIVAARQIAERIANRLSEADKRDGLVQPSALERYFRFLVAQYTNDFLSGYVRDWQRGRRLSAQDVIETAALAKSLHEWLDKQSLSLFIKRGVEIAGSRGAILMGGAYDTLAVYELMAAASKSPFTKENCDRGIALLNASKNVWDALHEAETIGAEGYLGVISAYRAHQNVFTNSCLS